MKPRYFESTLFVLALIAAPVISAFAEDPAPAEAGTEALSPEQEAEKARILNALSKINPQGGEIAIGDGLATVVVPDDLRYVDAEGARVILEDLWRNPHGSGTLGMLIPTGVSPLDDASWAVIITYEDSGHVKDDDAASIDYADLLKDMQKDTRENNKARAEAGYPEIELIGWAAQPHYDSAAKKLYWAKELRFAGSGGNTLNYNIRVLGRKGVLNLNVVGGMNQLAQIEENTPHILTSVDFRAGNRYADFNAATDHVAEYGIATLIAGGIAAKTGLLKALWLGILAFKKFIILGVVAGGGLIAKLFKSRKNAFQSNDTSAG